MAPYALPPFGPPLLFGHLQGLGFGTRGRDGGVPQAWVATASSLGREPFHGHNWYVGLSAYYYKQRLSNPLSEAYTLPVSPCLD